METTEAIAEDSNGKVEVETIASAQPSTSTLALASGLVETIGEEGGSSNNSNAMEEEEDKRSNASESKRMKDDVMEQEHQQLQQVVEEEDDNKDKVEDGDTETEDEVNKTKAGIDDQMQDDYDDDVDEDDEQEETIKSLSTSPAATATAVATAGAGNTASETSSAGESEAASSNGRATSPKASNDKQESNNNNSKKSSSSSSSTSFQWDKGLKHKAKCAGECNNSEYSHDYLHCSRCNITAKPCLITHCPCEGKGFLIPVGRDHLFSHQLPNHTKSVRICVVRPNQAIERIKKVLDRGPASNNRNKSKKPLQIFAKIDLSEISDPRERSNYTIESQIFGIRDNGNSNNKAITDLPLPISVSSSDPEKPKLPNLLPPLPLPVLTSASEPTMNNMKSSYLLQNPVFPMSFPPRPLLPFPNAFLPLQRNTMQITLQDKNMVDWLQFHGFPGLDIYQDLAGQNNKRDN